MLLQHAASAPHPLNGTVAEWMWLLPLLPLLGFVINGLLSLVPATHFGPSDPDVAHDASHGQAAGTNAHADDHHAVARHRFAGLTSFVGPAVLALSFALALAIFVEMRSVGEMHTPFIQQYFEWMPAGGFSINAAFQLDQLSMVMILVITGVGTLIHIFSVGYMQDDPGYPRYFSYLNLFVAFMLVLVLGASHPVLFVGWEGV